MDLHSMPPEVDGTLWSVAIILSVCSSGRGTIHMFHMRFLEDLWQSIRINGFVDFFVSSATWNWLIHPLGCPCRSFSLRQLRLQQILWREQHHYQSDFMYVPAFPLLPRNNPKLTSDLTVRWGLGWRGVQCGWLSWRLCL